MKYVLFLLLIINSYAEPLKLDEIDKVEIVHLARNVSINCALTPDRLDNPYDDFRYSTKAPYSIKSFLKVIDSLLLSKDKNKVSKFGIDCRYGITISYKNDPSKNKQLKLYLNSFASSMSYQNDDKVYEIDEQTSKEFLAFFKERSLLPP